MNKKIGRCLSTAPSKPALVFYVKSRIHHLKVFVNLSTNYFRAAEKIKKEQVLVLQLQYLPSAK